ncbi:sensor histidine kinase [Azohydromonas aeria]|uniref:sensor histidine kinase n=1 Tax=Azohydromonas aeria TaxID=2590212 RepID=UPI0012FA5168|nr:ATP-binding protein [Azohydromonas aeria]
MESVDLCALVQELLLLLEPLAQEQGVCLLMPSESLPPVHARTDRNRVRQVLLNILSNAIKYNRRGGTVTVVLREAGDQVELELADTGIGMSAEQLQGLFEPFNRLGREGSGIEGTGIGMALTRRLVELLDGSMSVNGEPNVGTCVRVRLPQAQHGRHAAATIPAVRPAEAAPAKPTDVEGPRGRVLYV